MTDRPASRIRIVLALVFLGVALSLLLLSGMGKFRSMNTFPWIFGFVWAFWGGLDLLLRRKSVRAPEKVLVAGGIVLALAAPVAQSVRLGVERGRSERAALARLAGQPAPRLLSDFAFNAGGDDESEPRAGRLTVVNFWATWCPPCVDELPMLDAWARRHDPSLVRVIGFTRLYGSREDEAAVRQELETIEAFLGEHGVGYLNLVERDGETHEAYAAHSMPSTVLVGRASEVLDFGIGRPGAERVLAAAEQLIGPASGRAGSGDR